jgi:hypothetical protein
MIMKERLPSLGRRTPSPRDILCDGSLPDINAELEKLAMNPRRAPQWVGYAHLANEITDFQRSFRPSLEVLISNVNTLENRHDANVSPSPA